MWNHQIDANLIYIALNGHHGDINKTIELLFEFEQWKHQDNNEQKYKKRINEFLEKRCCNHNVNLFCMFRSEIYKGSTGIKRAATYTVNNGLPFVEKDKKN
ncbi:hypothetical protein RFI_36658 [Reticulomyxa filosa]|uniref:Uncharacterized protein n=1 Tax=Reticulomyxa filosa TaxID=46433 RepID=X6LI17_RETFI|nr:hypothetical protein RFI_36658 [Reticulomyxa filosa]|eukprot:ETO00782.1 hypothetical protein RFI_36658 [Reticulomyxa filosa]